MAPANKKVKPVEDHEEIADSMRVAAEKKLTRSHKTSPDLKGGSPEQLIHELRVHQIELETQGEELRRIQHELEKSRYKYIDLYEFAPVGYLSLNGKTLVTEANLTAATLLGLERSKLVDHGFGQFIAPEDLERWDQYVLGLRCEQEKQVINLTIMRGDSITFPGRLEGIRMAFDDGSFVIHITISDISDIVSAQEELRTSHSRLETAMEVGKLAWWEMECSTGKVSFSEQKAQMLGYPAEKFSHYSDFTTLLHPDDYEFTMQAMRDHLSGVNKNYEADYRIHTLNGEYRWFHDTGGISTFGPDGAPLRVTGLVMDITERKQADLALRESEEKFRQLFTHMPAAVAIYVPILDGSDFIFKDFNTAAEAIEGIKKSDLVGKRVSEVFPGVTEFGLFEVFKRVWKTGVAEYYPAALYRDDRDPGSWRENWVYKLASGEIIAIYHDITDRKRVEDALRESEERYRGLIDGVPDYILVHRNGKILFVNPAAMEVIGRGGEDPVGSDILNYIAPESRALVVAMVTKRASGELIPPYEITIITKGGERRVTEVHGSLIMYAGQPASLNVLSDITGRKQAEDALRESEERYRSLFERMDEGFCVVEMLYAPDGKAVDYRFVEINPAFEKQTGLSQALGKTIRQMVPNHEAHWFEIYGKVAQTGEAIRFDNPAAAMHRYYDVFAFRVGGDGSQKVGVLFNEISDRKNAEEMREHLLHDLSQKNTELERFTYTVSHDLKSPLITIKGFLGYLEKDMLAGDPGRVHEDIMRIHTATDKMEDFIGALLELSRVGRIVNPPVRTPLVLLVQEAVEALDTQIQERGVTFIVPQELPEVYGDQLRLQQVMTNLIGNAVKFMGDQEEPRIEVSAYHKVGVTTICIVDNGIGISHEDLDNVFSIFTRLNPAIPGTGIGLALVKRVVEMHGGDCSVESPGLGKGSTFCFSLPDSPDRGKKS